MSYDVIIIGLGAMGASAAYHLARRDIRVLGIEQFGIAHDRGSSHGLSRMIRMAYSEHPDYVPLLRRAYELWDELGEAAGAPVLRRTGGIYLGRGDSAFVAESRRAAIEHNLPYEPLDATEIARRFPPFHPPDDATGVFDPVAGFVEPESAIRGHLRLAAGHGATIMEHTRVLGWHVDGNGVAVATPQATYHGQQLILAAGAWFPRLAAGLQPRLWVSRQPLMWFEPNPGDIPSLQRLPVWAVGHPRGGVFYGFPLHPPAPGLKCALHQPGREVDPDEVDRTPHPADEIAVRQGLDQWLPGVAGRVLDHRICLYTNSPDGHFIIDRHPDFPQALIASCCSGHGFKFAPVIGEVLADLATTGSTRHPVEFLRLARLMRPSTDQSK